MNILTKLKEVEEKVEKLYLYLVQLEISGQKQSKEYRQVMQKIDGLTKVESSLLIDTKDYYDDIMQDRDKVFTQSIPVFTTLLRPVDPNASSLYYESTNGLFYMMSRLTWELNEFAEKKMKGKSTSEHQLLYDLQVRYTKLCDEIDEIMQGKKGAFRSLLAGRYNFSSRCVIVPNPKLRIDQVMLPYAALVELLQQRIVNIIQKSYNKSYADAYDIWYRATIQPDIMIKNIIQTIIDNSCDGQGIPLIINRNPTIAYGGIMQMFCIGMNDAYVMEVPLQILPPLAADFDKRNVA